MTDTPTVRAFYGDEHEEEEHDDDEERKTLSGDMFNSVTRAT